MSEAALETEDEPATRYSAQDIIDMGQEEPEPKSRKMVFVVLALLLFMSGGAGAYFMGAVDPVLAMLAGEPSEPEMQADAGPTDNTASSEPAIYFELPDVLVNMNKQGRGRSFLKVKLSLELADAGSVARVEMLMPRIQDKVQMYLRDMRMEDLQGAAAIQRLRLDLLDRVKNSVEPTPVYDVLFRELIIQ